ncbi:unnamed protein product [Dracunculus medinensis]|uniref:Coiled-coil domain-containing protein 39 n=1 Tax=Dracunculus medinensis TaxID=318479 RepID=A0A158Q404_DRAME|nr:unnamed protein product [Dracunculus medinensis]
MSLIITEMDKKLSDDHEEIEENEYKKMTAENSHLTRYQTLLRNHLSNLNDQLELQIKDQRLLIKENNQSIEEKQQKLENIKRECKKFSVKNNVKSVEIDEKQIERQQLMENIVSINKRMENDDREFKSNEKKEIELRELLSKINISIGDAFSINHELNRNEENNVKVTKRIFSQSQHQFNSMNNEKLLQTNYINRLKRDVKAAEAELSTTAKKLDRIERMIEEDSTALENQWKNLTRNQKRSEEKIRFNESSALKEKENIKLLKRKGKQLDAEQIKIEHEIEEIERKNFFIHEIGIFSKKLDNFADLISRKKLIVEKFKKDLQSAEKKSANALKQEIISLKKKEEYISDNIKSLEAKLSAYNNNINESKQNIEQFANVVENLERNLQHIQEESVKLSEKYKTDRSTNELREKTKLERNSNIDLRQKINIDRQKAEKLRCELEVWKEKLEDLENGEKLAMFGQNDHRIIEIRQLKNYYSDIQKKIRNVQKDIIDTNAEYVKLRSST